jgi:hypothetical protein
MHHPRRIAHPEWDTTADTDKARGIRTAGSCSSSSPALVLGTHFAGATGGRIVRDGDPAVLILPDRAVFAAVATVNG